MKKTTLFLHICLLLVIAARAQQEDALPKDTLRTATVVDQRLVSMERLRLHHLDSLDRQMHASSNLGELLQQAGALNLKVYGPGGISSLSVRGGQSSQTTVLWNGINLQDPLNGGVNFSLIPSFFIDEVDIHAGGYSALFGSGAMSGSIHTSSQLRFDEGLRLGLHQTLASFGAKQSGLDLRYSGKRFLNISKFFYREAENDFTFVNTQAFGDPVQTQRNAREKEMGLMQENAFLLGKKMRLSSHLWWTHNKHQIPSNMTVMNARQSQEDESLKALLSWKRIGRWKWNVRSAAFYSYLKYINPDADMVAEHRSFVQSNEAEVRKEWNKTLVLDMGFAHRYTKGISEQLTLSNPELNSLAGFASLEWKYKELWSLRGNVRKEARAQEVKPASYSLHLSSGEWKGFRFWTSFSRNYRMPTFNDLYWQDGYSKGNPDLLDESGYSGDVNLSWQQQINQSQIQLMTSLYRQDISQMIQWLPIEGIWTPVNHQKVRSRGLEARFLFSQQINKFRLSYKCNYQYTRSTLEELANGNTDLVGNQLIYTPMHQASGRVSLSFHGYSLAYESSYIGSRYTTADNKELMMLDPILLHHVQVGKCFDYKKHSFRLNFRIRNISDQNYQLVRLYPMPGRYYSFEFNYFLKYKK